MMIIYLYIYLIMTGTTYELRLAPTSCISINAWSGENMLKRVTNIIIDRKKSSIFMGFLMSEQHEMMANVK